MSTVIKMGGDAPLGVKWWALWDKTKTPMYELYKWVGSRETARLWFFEHRRTGKIICLSTTQLIGSNFKPFVIDSASCK